LDEYVFRYGQIAKTTPCPQFLLHTGLIVVRYDDEQIHIAVLVRLPPGMGAEQVYLTWLKLGY